MNFVSNWIAYSNKNPHYRFLAVREPVRNPRLPGMEDEPDSDMTSTIMSMSGLEPDLSLSKEWYKVSGVATNRTLWGDGLLRWYRERCGKSEEVHGILKRGLTAGRLPSGLFGANAA